MKLIGKKIFLTGGMGFIGTALAQRLHKDNEVVIYDNQHRNSIKDTNLIGHENIEVITGDVLDPKKLIKSMRGSDVIVHLAGIAGVDTVIARPVETMKVNLLGIFNVLEAAINLGGIDRFINFSTSEVYGSYAYKLDELDNTPMGAVGQARWTYATSKLAGEHLALSFFRESGLPVVSVRPFNIYGPGQVGEGAIHIFVKRALEGEDLVIQGDGGQIRSWCFIDDVVDGVILCMEKKNAVGEVFNMGNPKGTITVLHLAEKIIQLTKSSSKIVHTPKKYVDVELRIPAIEKAVNLLGYKLKVDLDEGLIETINWYKKK